MARRALIFTLVLCMAFVFGGCAKKEEAPKQEAPMAAAGDGRRSDGERLTMKAAAGGVAGRCVR